MYNLKIRIKAELDKAYEKFQRYNLLNDKDRQKLDRYKITESRIEIALNELDKTLMILSEF